MTDQEKDQERARCIRRGYHVARKGADGKWACQYCETAGTELWARDQLEKEADVFLLKKSSRRRTSQL